MTHADTFARTASAKASALFSPRPYAQRRLLNLYAAKVASWSLPLLSAVAGAYYLAYLLGMHMPTMAAWALSVCLLCLAEAVKASSLREAVREWYTGHMGGQILVALLGTLFTAYMALHGADTAISQQSAQVEGLRDQQHADALRTIRQEHAAEVAELRELQSRLASQRWISPETQRSISAYQEAERQSMERLQQQEAALSPASSAPDTAADMRGPAIVLVMLLEMGMAVANFYVMRWYWRVWCEQLEGNSTGNPNGSQDMEQQAEQLLASMAERRHPICTPATESSQQPIGFSVPQKADEKERRFFQMWAAGERNPRVFSQELRISLQQYKSYKEKMKLS